MDYFIYLVLGFLILFVEINRERYFVIDHLSIFNFFFFLVYSFTPLALKYYGTDILAIDLSLGKYYLWRNEYTSLFILASYIAFLAGYYMMAQRNFAKRINIEFKFTRDTLMSIMPFVYLLLVGVLIIYLQAQGGLMATIAKAEQFRGGVIFAKYGFLIRLFPLNQILLFYFFYLVLLEKDKQYQQTNMIYLVISFSLFFLMAAMYNSRTYLLSNFLGLYIMTAMYYKNYFLNYLTVAGGFGVIVIKYADPLFYAIPEFLDYGFEAFLAELNNRVSLKNLEDTNIVANFSHPIISLETSLYLSGGEVPFRYFVDFIHAFISLLPSILLGFEDPQYIMELNTELVFGEKISIALPGILALFSYSMHFVGMIIGMFIYGLIGGFLSEMFKKIFIKYNSSIIFIYLMSFTYGYFVFRGSPRNALLAILIQMLVIVTLLFFSKISLERKGNKS